jgi:hypothetical protein
LKGNNIYNISYEDICSDLTFYFNIVRRLLTIILNCTTSKTGVILFNPATFYWCVCVLCINRGKLVVICTRVLGNNIYNISYEDICSDLTFYFNIVRRLLTIILNCTTWFPHLHVFFTNKLHIVQVTSVVQIVGCSLV